MQLTSNNIQTPTGDAIDGAQVLVKIGVDNALLFSDNGVTPIANPVITDANGIYKFFAANGRYNITVTSTKLAAPIQYNDVILFDPKDSNYSPTIVSDLANQTNPSLGASLVGWIRNALGTLGRTVSDKLSDVVNIKDFDGANGSAKLNAAHAASKDVEIRSGTFDFPTTPVVAGITEVWGNANITGAGLAALGYVEGVQRQLIHSGTTGADFATQYIRRNALHTGGVPTYVSSALKVDTYVAAGATNYEWGFLSKMDSSATGGQNVAGYLQSTKRGTGPVWAGVFELIEPATVNNPISGSVPVEIDLRANGTDSFNNRVGVDLVITRRDAAGPALSAGYGYRLQTANDASTTITYGYGFAAGTKVSVGFDTTQATTLQAAIKIAQGQTISFDASAVTSLAYDTAGIAYSISGVKKSRLSDDGGIELFGLRTKIVGSFTSGASTATTTANKPGANAGIISWMSVTLDGQQGWVPVYGN